MISHSYKFFEFHCINGWGVGETLLSSFQNLLEQNQIYVGVCRLSVEYDFFCCFEFLDSVRVSEEIKVDEKVTQHTHAPARISCFVNFSN